MRMGSRYPRKQRRDSFPGKVVKRDDNKTKHSKSLKNKLRDVQRLLRKPDLPATVQVVQERMLEVLTESIKDKATEDRERKMMKRYKKVKFFEKRKLFRKYKTCVKELNECEDDETRTSLLKELEEIKLQWNYIIHFPRDTKYVCLFPHSSFTNHNVRKKQEKILEVISEKVSSGELNDASATISQMGRGSKERNTAKFRLRELGGQVKQTEASIESDDETPPPKLNGDDDFFLDSSPSMVPPTSEEEKKKNATNRKKRSELKFKRD